METMEQHLRSRGMNTDLYRMNIDEENRIATFYLYNLSGQVVGYQQYNPNGLKKIDNNPKEGKYYTHCKNRIGVWGLEFNNPNDKRMFVVEGLFKASKLHSLGYNAIAVLGNAPKPLKNWFWQMSATHDMIAIGDNDAAGAQLVRIVGKGTQSVLDLDEMECYDVVKLVEQFN